MAKIYFSDLTPCDDMQSYKEVSFIPKFVKDDTRLFDTEHTRNVVQVATPYGWCIVAKWSNNGSTRIYAASSEALEMGVEILSGKCDSGDCNYAYGEKKYGERFINEDDYRVFYGWDIFDVMAQDAEEPKTDVEKIYKLLTESTECTDKDAEKLGIHILSMVIAKETYAFDRKGAFLRIVSELATAADEWKNKLNL